jgi:hypothetical protein
VLKVADFNNLSNNDIIPLLQDYCTPKSWTDFYFNLKAATTYLSPNLVLNNGTNNFELFYKAFNLYIKTFKYAYTFLIDYTASKHEIPFTNTKCDSVPTLKNLFLSRLPKSLIGKIYGKTHQRLSRYKNIESLIRSSEKAVHTLFKQYCKSCQAIGVNWWFGETEASPRDPLEEWVILQYDPGGRLRTLQQNTDTVWSSQAQYHSLEDRITLQFDPGGTNDAW